MQTFKQLTDTFKEQNKDLSKQAFNAKYGYYLNHNLEIRESVLFETNFLKKDVTFKFRLS